MTTATNPDTHTYEMTTRSGIELLLRRATEDDAAALTAFFDKVSDEDRRFRFFAAGEHVSPDQLEPLIHADHFRTESFVAFDKATGELVCSGLLASDKALDTAEVAVSVAAHYRGKGVAWTMLDALGIEARARPAPRDFHRKPRQSRRHRTGARARLCARGDGGRSDLGHPLQDR
jgi:acetyltransferase